MVRRGARQAPRLWLLPAALLPAALLPTVLAAQTGPVAPIRLEEVEVLGFDRPESWAMKYFASVSLLTGLGTPGPVEPGSIELAFESGLVPSLGEEKRRVGFLGSKVEDLNRTNLFGRLRITFGLPRQFAVTLGFTPPLEMDGVTPTLYNLAIARPVLDTSGWRLGLRLHAQTGAIEGDLTCPRDVAGLDDPVRNPDGCLASSDDEVTLEYVGLELSVTPKVWGERWEPHLAVSVNRMDLDFQVRARYSVFDDRNLLVTEGTTLAAAAGLAYRWSDRLEIAGEVFYAPLEVERDPQRGARNDELVNARLLLGYRLR